MTGTIAALFGPDNRAAGRLAAECPEGKTSAVMPEKMISSRQLVLSLPFVSVVSVEMLSPRPL